ncbi:helix-turn-helix domain-containing protein [Aquihabitans sp. G128]|uniref:helix-turn-helix domain-containing protein n=1 Tax=Aquihabitans sp. G128 TaxID=2849779 RepID=UPI001C23E95C|nr:helix-turn-helix domain-containing protein [Aquihabitans sp. G128]QXC61948.1 helix-turn-helix domain-containing protein [Aquihabitans sp. G128]
MDARTTLRRARHHSGLSLRALAQRAGTSHATISAYEQGRKVPSVETLARLVRAAGFELAVELEPAVGGPDRAARGRELEEVLALAAEFPARHAERLAYPAFGARPR